MKKIITLFIMAVLAINVSAQTVDSRMQDTKSAAKLIEQADKNASQATRSLMKLFVLGNVTSADVIAFRSTITSKMEIAEEQQDEIAFYAFNSQQINPEFDPQPLASLASQIEAIEDGIQNTADAALTAYSLGDFTQALQLLSEVDALIDQQYELAKQAFVMASNNLGQY